MLNSEMILMRMRGMILMLVILMVEKRSAPHSELVTGEWRLLLFYELSLIHI